VKRFIAATTALAGLSACSGAAGTPPAPPALSDATAQSLRSAVAAPLHRRASTPIQHVVFVIQENRSFNNLFMGYPGATTATSGLNSSGQTIPLAPVSLAAKKDIEHLSADFFAACDGNPPGQNCKMDGWNNEIYGPANFPYAYVPRKQVKPYWDMAGQYVLADNMFASNIDASFVAHQYAVAAYASGAVDLPTGTWGCGGGGSDTVNTLNQDRSYGSPIAPCFDNVSLAQELDAAGLPWRYYVTESSGGVWDGFQAISPIYNGPDWTADTVNPSTQFLTDVANGNLAAVTWITPSEQDSDHSSSDSKKGPSWVASVVNAVGNSKFWNDTAIFVMWDEWGGWYDPVAPPYEDYDGLGFRVPLLVISPYAKQGYVSHVQYETASVLRFIEDDFGLAQMAAADARANDPAGDCFNFSQQPRAFKKIAAEVPASVFVRERTGAPPDDE
jgi:phospholipase C